LKDSKGGLFRKPFKAIRGAVRSPMKNVVQPTLAVLTSTRAVGKVLAAIGFVFFDSESMTAVTRTFIQALDLQVIDEYVSLSSITF